MYFDCYILDDTENIDKVISLAWAAIIRLEVFNKIPEDLVRSLLRTFQTSSIMAFNDIFKHMEKQRPLDQALSTIVREREQLTPAGIFSVASKRFRVVKYGA